METASAGDIPPIITGFFQECASTNNPVKSIPFEELIIKQGDLTNFVQNTLIRQNGRPINLMGKLEFNKLLARYISILSSKSCNSAADIAKALNNKLNADIDKIQTITINGNNISGATKRVLYESSLQSLADSLDLKYIVYILTTALSVDSITKSITNFLKSYLNRTYIYKIAINGVYQYKIKIARENGQVTMEVIISAQLFDNNQTDILFDKLDIKIIYNLTQKSYSITQLTFGPKIIDLLKRKINFINNLKEINATLNISIPFNTAQSITARTVELMTQEYIYGRPPQQIETKDGYTVKFVYDGMGKTTCERNNKINPSELLLEIRKKMQEPQMQPQDIEELNKLIDDIETENAICIDQENLDRDLQKPNTYSFDDFSGSNIVANGLYIQAAPEYSPPTFFRFVKKVWPQIKNIFNNTTISEDDKNKLEAFFSILNARKKLIETNNQNIQKDPNDPYKYGLTIRTIRDKCGTYDFAIPNKELGEFLKQWKLYSVENYNKYNSLIEYINRERSNCNNSNFLTRSFSYKFKGGKDRKTRKHRRRVKGKQRAKPKTVRAKRRTKRRRSSK